MSWQGPANANLFSSQLRLSSPLWSNTDIYGYGSIPINSIFSGMNIHLPAILMWTTGVPGFWPIPIYIYIYTLVYTWYYDTTAASVHRFTISGFSRPWGKFSAMHNLHWGLGGLFRRETSSRNETNCHRFQYFKACKCIWYDIDSNISRHVNPYDMIILW